MGLRRAFLLSSIAALLFWMAFAPGVGGANSSDPFVIKIGYSSQELFNVANEVPIFVPGDQLWVSFGYNQSLALALTSPSGVVVTPKYESAAPNTVFLLYSFATNDTVGYWTLTLHNYPGALLARVTIDVVPAGGGSPPGVPRLVDSTVTKNGSLDLRFAEGTGLANGLTACLLPGAVSAPAQIKFPQKVGNYTLVLDERNGSLIARFVPSGGVGTPPSFDMWAELRYVYSFTSPLNPHLVTKGELRAAQTQPSAFSSPLVGSNFTLPLLQQGYLRVGTYSVLVYFRNSAGLFLEESSVLLLKDGTWLWYGACSASVPVSGSFSLSEPLASPANWPSTMVITYQDNGTQGYIESKVPTNLTSISVSPTPWGGQLPGGYTVGVTQNPDVASAQIFGGNLYVQLRHFPTSFQAYVKFQGSNVDTQTFNVSQKYDLLPWGIPLGKLQVAVQLDSKYAPGASVKVTDAAGTAASGTTGNSGTFSYLLPPGSYNVAVSLANMSSTQQAFISSTLEGTLVYSFTTPTNYWPDYALVALGILGISANVLVWRGVLRRSPS